MERRQYFIRPSWDQEGMACQGQGFTLSWAPEIKASEGWKFKFLFTTVIDWSQESKAGQGHFFSKLLIKSVIIKEIELINSASACALGWVVKGRWSWISENHLARFTIWSSVALILAVCKSTRYSKKWKIFPCIYQWAWKCKSFFSSTFKFGENNEGSDLHFEDHW